MVVQEHCVLHAVCFGSTHSVPCRVSRVAGATDVVGMLVKPRQIPCPDALSSEAFGSMVTDVARVVDALQHPVVQGLHTALGVNPRTECPT